MEELKNKFVHCKNEGRVLVYYSVALVSNMTDLIPLLTKFLVQIAAGIDDMCHC